MGNFNKYAVGESVNFAFSGVDPTEITRLFSWQEEPDYEEKNDSRCSRCWDQEATAILWICLSSANV